MSEVQKIPPRRLKLYMVKKPPCKCFARRFFAALVSAKDCRFVGSSAYNRDADLRYQFIGIVCDSVVDHGDLAGKAAFLFLRARIANAIRQIMTEISDPEAVASPIGNSVVGNIFEVRYTPGIRMSRIAERL